MQYRTVFYSPDMKQQHVTEWSVPMLETMKSAVDGRNLVNGARAIMERYIEKGGDVLSLGLAVTAPDGDVTNQSWPYLDTVGKDHALAVGIVGFLHGVHGAWQARNMKRREAANRGQLHTIGRQRPGIRDVRV